MTLGHKLKALNAYEKLKGVDETNYSESWAQGLDDMNSSRLWMTWATSSHELEALDVMNNLELWIIWTTQDPVSTGL